MEAQKSGMPCFFMSIPTILSTIILNDTVYCVIVVPTAPRNLNYTNLTATGVTLTWKRPDPPNGLIVLYYVSDIAYMANYFSFPYIGRIQHQSYKFTM